MKILICQKCNRRWKYNGKARFYATCPQCYTKVNIKNQKVLVMDYTEEELK